MNVSGGGYGLLFGLDNGFEQYYLFVVNADYQEYALYYYGANGYEAIVNRTYSSLIHTGSSNHLKVIRSDNQITLGINGSFLGTWTDTRTSGSTGVGLFNMPYSNIANADVRYDNYSVILRPGGTYSSTALLESQSGLGLFSPSRLWVKQENIIDSLPTGGQINH